MSFSTLITLLLFSFAGIFWINKRNSRSFKNPFLKYVQVNVFLIMRPKHSSPFRGREEGGCLTSFLFCFVFKLTLFLPTCTSFCVCLYFPELSSVPRNSSLKPSIYRECARYRSPEREQKHVQLSVRVSCHQVRFSFTFMTSVTCYVKSTKAVTSTPEALRLVCAINRNIAKLSN